MRSPISTFMIVILLMVTVFVNCSQEPTEELEAAEKAFLQANDFNAQQYATESYAKAESKMNQGKKLINSKRYKDARTVLVEAKKLSDVAAMEAKKAKQEEEIRLAELEAQRQAEEQKRIQEEIKRQEELKKQTKTYTVKKGDCLWNIAKALYDNPVQWKQIYEANKDIIDNPDLIFPGQTFVIPPVAPAA